MALEVGTRIADLVATNPLSSDPAGQGDDHLRLIKACVQGSLPNIGGILGQARQLDVATSLSSTWNTQHIFCTSSATATVVLTLPPATSVTSGFYFDITALAGAAVSLVPSGAVLINGAASLSIPERSTCHVFYIGSGWRANVMPSGLGGISVVDTLQVNGNASISGTLSVNGALVVNGTAIIRSNARLDAALSVSGAAHMNTTLSVGGAVTLASTLSVSGNATLLGGLDVKGGTASFSTAVYMGSTLTVSGATVLNGLTVNSPMTVNSGLTTAALKVNATTTLSGAVHMTTTLSVGGAVTLADALTVGSTLSVSGNAVVGGTLAVNGALSAASGSFGGGGFTGNLTLGGTLTVSGATVLASTIAVRGAATLDTTLSVSGAATFKSASSFAASVVIGTTLNVAGATTLSGAATLKGTVSIGGAANLGSTLTVSGTVAFLGLLQLGGNLNLNNGIINFPAVQNPSAGANSLDDYEEGTWTPFIDYAVTGNLNVVYSLQSGTYTKIGRHVTACFTLTTSTYTHTTASGTMVISGFPFASTFAAHGTLNFEGMLISTSPNYDGPILRLATGTTAALTKSGINSNAMADLDQNSHTSGVNVQMNGTISYGAA